MSFFRKNILEKLSDKVEAKIKQKVGPVSTKQLGRFGDSGTAEEWSDYEDRAIANCPNLVKLRNAIDNVEHFFYRLKRKYYIDPKFFLKNIFIHPMWLVRAKTLKIGQWVDADTRILHTNMQMLSDFIEKEKEGKPWEVTEYENYEKDRENAIYNEQDMDSEQFTTMLIAWDIYNWWKTYPDYEKRIDAIYESIPNDNTGVSLMHRFTSKNLEKNKDFYEKVRLVEQERDCKEQEMLLNLIAIRKSLWT